MKDPVLISVVASLLLFLVAHFTGVISAYAAASVKEPKNSFYGPAIAVPSISAIFFGPILYTMIT